MNASPILDPAALERLRRLGGDAFLREMIGLFLDYAGRKVAEARQAGTEGNLPAIQQAAHPIKSSAGNVGATRVQALAAKVEQEARDGQVEALQGSLAELEAAFQEASAALTAELSPAPNPPTP